MPAKPNAVFTFGAGVGVEPTAAWRFLPQIPSFSVFVLIGVSFAFKF